MNRFAAEGLLAEADAGKRVAVVAATSVLVWSAFHELQDLAGDRPESVRCSNGRELIRFPSGGQVEFWPARSASLRARGRDLDVVFVDVGADALIADYSSIRPALAVTGGSIVRA